MWLNFFWITFGFLTLFSMLVCYAGCVAAKRVDHTLRIVPYAEQLDRHEQNMPHATLHEATYTNSRL